MNKFLSAAELEVIRMDPRTDGDTWQRAAAAYYKAVKSNECTRCNGKGTIRGFGHIEGGKCFACNGTGKIGKRGRK